MIDIIRTGRSIGGGVLIALKNSIKSDAIDTSSITRTIPLVDLLFCVCSSRGYKFYLVLLYIPPDTHVKDGDFL